MPHTKQAAKDLRQSVKKARKNAVLKSHIKTLIKKSRASIVENDGKAPEYIKEVIKRIDKAAQKGILKKNTAARKKSRIMLAYNKSQVKK